MSRIVKVGAAQMGPVARRESRGAVVDRLILLMRQAGEAACGLAVFPELALTSFPVGLDAEPPEATALAPFHNHLVMQAGACQNACWVIGVAKAGHEECYDMIGQSAIIAPSGEIVAMCRTVADEIVAHDCDLDAGKYSRDTVFNFAAHRRTEHYGLIVERTGVGPRIVPWWRSATR